MGSAIRITWFITEHTFHWRWTAYLIVFGIFGGGAYLTFLSSVLKPKKPRVAALQKLVLHSPVRLLSREDTTKSGSPEHHLKKTKESGAVTSQMDAETSAGGASGKNGPRRRKGKK